MWENWKCVCESKGERLYLMYLWIIKIMLHLHFILQYGMYNDIYIYYIYDLQQGHLYWQGFSPLKVD